jgi:hypothetical protein
MKRLQNGLNMKKTYLIDLTDYDIIGYKTNPVVSYNFDYSQPPVGRACIDSSKILVEVDFNVFQSQLFYITSKHRLEPQYRNIAVLNSALPRRLLIGLSLVPA